MVIILVSFVLSAFAEFRNILRRLPLSKSALVFAVLAAVGLLANLAPPGTTAAQAGARSNADASAGVPERAIPTASFVIALQDGDLAVAFAAQPGGIGRLELTTTVIGPDGKGASGLRVALALVATAEARGRAVPCGPGCYRATLPFAGTPRFGVVTIKRLGHVPSTVRFPFPSRWPPRPAATIVRQATDVFSHLRSVTIDERLGSSATAVTHAHWRLEAPDRLTYAIVGGSQAVIIGNRRWDRDPGQRWVASPQTPVPQPTSAWGSAPRRAALLGSGRVDGRAVWRISFVKPGVPEWFTLAVDKQTLRTLELRMIAPAHFMHHVYGGFNDQPQIHPPRR